LKKKRWRGGGVGSYDLMGLNFLNVFEGKYCIPLPRVSRFFCPVLAASLLITG